MFNETQKADLAAPLSAGNVKTRQQAGRKLSYIEGWQAIAEANRIFGFDSWTRETIEMRPVAEHQRKIGKEPNTRDGWGVSYVAKVKVIVFAGDTLVTREGIGAGHGIDTDLGLAHESAAKEAETDAMKRALMTFGNPFGLALYDKEQREVENGNGHHVPADNSPALSAALLSESRQKETILAWRSWREDPRTQGRIDALSEVDYAKVKTELAAHRKALNGTEPTNPIGAG